MRDGQVINPLVIRCAPNPGAKYETAAGDTEPIRQLGAEDSAVIGEGDQAAGACGQADIDELVFAQKIFSQAFIGINRIAGDHRSVPPELNARGGAQLSFKGTVLKRINGNTEAGAGGFLAHAVRGQIRAPVKTVAISPGAPKLGGVPKAATDEAAPVDFDLVDELAIGGIRNDEYAIATKLAGIGEMQGAIVPAAIIS